MRTQVQYANRRLDVNGWVAISRHIFDHKLCGAGSEGKYSRMEAWLWIVANAAWKPTKAFDGVLDIDLAPGELIAPIRYLAKKWNWSLDAVRGFLDALAEAHSIDRSKRTPSTHAAHVISLVNWEKYQLFEEEGAHEANATPTPSPTQNPTSSKRKEPVTITSPNGEVSSADIEALEAFTTYNSLALQLGLPQASTLTPARKQKIKARLKEHGGIAGFQKALANLKRSRFLLGSNDRNWKA